jgi:hypothetical protein
MVMDQGVSRYLFTYLFVLFPPLGWSGTESTLTEATTALLYQLQMMTDDECEAMCNAWQGKLKYSDKTCPQCRFVHRKSHTTWPTLEPGLPQWEVGN